jgi:hypothetical protein
LVEFLASALESAERDVGYGDLSTRGDLAVAVAELETGLQHLGEAGARSYAPSR